MTRVVSNRHGAPRAVSAVSRRAPAPGRRAHGLRIVTLTGERPRGGSKVRGRLDFAIGVLIGLLLVGSLFLVAG